MDNIGVVGISHRQSSLDALDRLTTLKGAAVARDLQAFRDSIGVKELVFLATCNRFEVAFICKPGDTASTLRKRIFAALTEMESSQGEAESNFRAWAGEGAVEHIFLVTAGLESARVGEGEIRLQVKQALEAACGAGVCGPLLKSVFQDALRLAKDAQRRMEEDFEPTSLADMAVSNVIEHLQGTLGPVALIGVSPMTRACFKQLTLRGIDIVVANRTLAYAQDLVAGTEAMARDLYIFLTETTPVRAAIVALGREAAPLKASQLKRLSYSGDGTPPTLLVDFGVPPNVPPAEAEKARLIRYGMEDMIEASEAERCDRLVTLAPVRTIVDEGLAKFRTRWAVQSAGAAITALQDYYRSLALDHTHTFLRRNLADLTPSQQHHVEEFAMGLARKFAHVPAKGVRALAADFGLPAVHDFLAAADKGLEESILSVSVSSEISANDVGE